VATFPAVIVAGPVFWASRWGWEEDELELREEDELELEEELLEEELEELLEEEEELLEELEELLEEEEELLEELEELLEDEEAQITCVVNSAKASKPPSAPMFAVSWRGPHCAAALTFTLKVTGKLWPAARSPILQASSTPPFRRSQLAGTGVTNSAFWGSICSETTTLLATPLPVFLAVTMYVAMPFWEMVAGPVFLASRLGAEELEEELLEEDELEEELLEEEQRTVVVKEEELLL
jgi:hypothetical protein